jgi:Nucleotidyltransferase of unknown function (DUF6036)
VVRAPNVLGVSRQRGPAPPAARAARPLPRLKKLLLRERDATAATPCVLGRLRRFSAGRGKRPAVGLTPELGRGPLAGSDPPLDEQAVCRYAAHMPLSADDIRTAFAALADELNAEHRNAEIVIAGGAALVLLYGVRQTTKDVDAYFVQPEASVIRRVASRVAEKLNLPDDWLNDGAKGYFVGVTKGDLLYGSGSLTVRAASTPQLLAMKLCAWRDAIDRGDARLLLSQLHGSFDEIWDAVKPFVPAHQVDKASYALQDLWDLSHAS